MVLYHILLMIFTFTYFVYYYIAFTFLVFSVFRRKKIMDLTMIAKSGNIIYASNIETILKHF